MAERFDLLLVNANSRGQVYGGLADLTAIEPPVWAGLIARHCMNKGFSVQILDAEAEGLTAIETAQRILDAQPRLAAFCIYGHQPSASTQCLPAASEVVRAMNGYSVPSDAGHVPTLALGTHPSALPERTLREEPFDYVCQGEGPRTIVELLQGNDRDAHGLFSAQFNFRCGPGLNKQSVPSIAPAQNIADLDAELSGQAWELLDMKLYRAHNWHLWTGDQKGGYASVQTSLGCAFKCSFCCINAPFTAGGEAPRLRKWSPWNVAGQIERLVTDYGITNIKIPDEMFVLDRAHVRGICEDVIAHGLGDRLNMWAYARVDTVKDIELLALMRRAGFRWLGIGIESGSQHVRDGVEKGHFGAQQIEAAVARVCAAGIAVAANYIFGLPDDTADSMRLTLGLAEHLNTEMANFYCAMAYPGSALHGMNQGRGVLPEDPSGPGWIGYSQHAYESRPLPTATLTYQEILNFRDEAFMHYFSRPEYLAMIEAKFGVEAQRQIIHMLSFGKPRRKHRDLIATPTGTLDPFDDADGRN